MTTIQKDPGTIALLLKYYSIFLPTLCLYIAHPVSQVAIFSHCPKQSYATAVKTITQYFAGTKEEGIVFKPPKKLYLDCFMDVDYIGVYN